MTSNFFPLFLVFHENLLVSLQLNHYSFGAPTKFPRTLTAMASKYVYQRHLPADYVRLLTLVSDGENLRGSLEEFRRDNLPYFNALSWCWSSRKERQVTSFECDDQLFPVSQRLYNLLSNLNPKNAHSSVRIW